jgi:hypothetical protein
MFHELPLNQKVGGENVQGDGQDQSGNDCPPEGIQWIFHAVPPSKACWFKKGVAIKSDIFSETGQWRKGKMLLHKIGFRIIVGFSEQYSDLR